MCVFGDHFEVLEESLLFLFFMIARCEGEASSVPVILLARYKESSVDPGTVTRVSKEWLHVTDNW